MASELTEKRRKFALAYLDCGNATEAVKRAGYKTKSPEVTGSRLLRNDKVLEFITKHRKRSEAVADVTKADVIKELWKLGTKAESESARVGALAQLVKALGMGSETLNVKLTPEAIAAMSDERLAEIARGGK